MTLKGDEVKQIHPFCIALSLTTLVEPLCTCNPQGCTLPLLTRCSLQDCLSSCRKLGYTSKSSPKAPHGKLLQWDVMCFQSGSWGRAHLMNLAKVGTHRSESHFTSSCLWDENLLFLQLVEKQCDSPLLPCLLTQRASAPAWFSEIYKHCLFFFQRVRKIAG